MAASRIRIAPVGIASIAYSIVGAQAHDRSLAAVLFDLRDGQGERLLFLVLHCRDSHGPLVLWLIVNPGPAGPNDPIGGPKRYPNKIRSSANPSRDIFGLEGIFYMLNANTMTADDDPHDIKPIGLVGAPMSFNPYAS